MEFSARDDVEAPIDYVFAQVTDFPSFERSIMRRGGDIERLQGGDSATVGTKWQVKFRMRGKERVVDALLTQVDAPNRLTVDFTSSSANGTMVVELVALSRARTRIHVTAKTSAKTIPAKLLFQSIRFARGRTDRRFKSLVSTFTEDVEARFRA